MDLSAAYYSNIASASSFDTDNDSILSMTSSIGDDEERREQKVETTTLHDHEDTEISHSMPELEPDPEPELEAEASEEENNDDCQVENDPDIKDDYIPESLSDFIASADKMYSDLVADLDLPSSSSFENNEENPKKKEEEDTQDFTKKTPDADFESSKTENVTSATKISKRSKVDIFSPVSDIASPQDPNMAELYNTVPTAKRKAFSPELSFEASSEAPVKTERSQNNLGDDFALEKKKDTDIMKEKESQDIDVNNVEMNETENEFPVGPIHIESGPVDEEIQKSVEPKHEIGKNVYDTKSEPELVTPTDSASVNESMEANFLPTAASALNDTIEDNFLPNKNNQVERMDCKDDVLFFENNENNISMDTDSSSSDDEMFFPNRNSIFKSVTVPVVSSKAETIGTKKKVINDDKIPKSNSLTKRRMSVPIKEKSRLLKPKTEPASKVSLSKNSDKRRKSTLPSPASRPLSKSSIPKRQESVPKLFRPKKSSTSTRRSITSTTPPKVYEKKPRLSTAPKVYNSSRSPKDNEKKPLRTRNKTSSLKHNGSTQRKKRTSLSVDTKTKETSSVLNGTKDKNKVKSPRDRALEIVKSKLAEIRINPCDDIVQNTRLVQNSSATSTSENFGTKQEAKKQKSLSKESFNMNNIQKPRKHPDHMGDGMNVLCAKDMEAEEKCDTVTTAENTLSSAPSTEEVDIDTKTLTDVSEISYTDQNFTPKKRLERTKKADSPSSKKVVDKSMQKHFERLKAAREKRLTSNDAFQTPVQMSSKLKKKLSSARKSSSAVRTIPREPNLLSSKRPRSRDRASAARKSLGGDPMHENPITTNWGAATHGNKHLTTPTTTTSTHDLTTPIGPKLSTSKRNGEKNYSTSSIVSCSDTATLESIGTKESYTPSLTEVVPFNLSTYRSEPKPKPIDNPTFGEYMNSVQEKGFRGIPTEDSKWKPGVTIPNPPNLSTPKPKDIKSQDQIDEELMEEARKNPFKARPVPIKLIESRGDQGLPKTHPTKITTPKPFRLRTSQRCGDEPPSTPSSEEIMARECKKQFHARPMPDLSYRPPKAPVVQKKTLTTPKPFRLHTESREAHFRQKTPSSEDRNAAECARQFQARVMPDLSYRPTTTPRIQQKSVTTPEPFNFVTKQKKKIESPQKLNNDDIELSKKFSARPLPDLTYRPPKRVSSHVKKPTCPVPFNLHTDLRHAVKSPSRVAEKEENSFHFQAKPMPDLRYKPPKAPKQDRTLTTPKPFRFQDRPTTPKSKRSQATEDDIELAKKFYARPIPESSKKSTGSIARRNVLEKLKRMRSKKHTRKDADGSVSSVGSSLTVPKPFNLQTEIRREIHEANLQHRLKDEEKLEHRLRQYKATPAPDFNRRPFTPKRSDKELTTPEPFQLESCSRHEVCQSQMEEQRVRESKELRQLSSFKAKLAPRAKAPFTPRLNISKKPSLSIGPNFETEVRARSREAFDKEKEQRKKNEFAKKRLLQRKKELEEKRELMAMRRKSVVEGGFCFKAKPINSIFKNHSKKSKVTPI